MEVEFTKGVVLFLSGLGGMALSVLLGMISSIALHSSRKKMQQKLDEVYKI